MPSARDIFLARKAELMDPEAMMKDSLKVSLQYSLLAEESVRAAAGTTALPFAVASGGSFCRRELAPYSDIDLLIILPDENPALLKEVGAFTAALWDSGLEVSHTTRTPEDIPRFLADDLHTGTQFLETRYLAGDKRLYDAWNTAVFSNVGEPDTRKRLLESLAADAALRHNKSGASPRVIEPNLKSTAGGLRDLQLAGWIHMVETCRPLYAQDERSYAELFLASIAGSGSLPRQEAARLLAAYRTVLMLRNLLHVIHRRKHDRLEFEDQITIAGMLGYDAEGFKRVMRDYFAAASAIHRFSRSFLKHIAKASIAALPEALAIDIDADFKLKGGMLFFRDTEGLSFSAILRAFYYRGSYGCRLDDDLRYLIIQAVDGRLPGTDLESSTFFREILRLPRNVGQTLAAMNELGVLGAFMPEFADLAGFMQHGVYHCYTADEHTIKTIENVEQLEQEATLLGRIFNSLPNREILYLALLFHDIAKPIRIAGHELLGAEIAASVMGRLNYEPEEIEQVYFLVENHLLMEQVAFRRNLNDPDTLNGFTARFAGTQQLDLLYLVTYADLSAVNPMLWTSWKSDMLADLYRKAKAMIEEKISGHDLLLTTVQPHEVSRHSPHISEGHVKDHIEAMNDLAYTSHFSDEEIARHVEEILSGDPVSVLFNEEETFTGITVITNDSHFLLSKLCGVLSVNDLNIHDARIFTRKDGIIIDHFSVTDFRTHKKIEPARYKKIEETFFLVLTGMLDLIAEMGKLKNRWWRLENRLFRRQGTIKITFEQHERFTIIDVHSPDRLGFLFHVTRKINDLGLNIHFAKISTQGDQIVDAFYVLDNNGRKIKPDFHAVIRAELTAAIHQIV